MPSEGATLANHREERFLVRDRVLSHAVLTDLHLKDGEFINVDFRHTRFRDSYFRKVTFRKCGFTGCIFDRCDFPHAKFVECTLSYSRWFVTQVDLGEVLPNLPYGWPNVARDLCQNLRLNAAGLGDGRAARRLLFRSMAFHREMLREQILQKQSWYRERYGVIERFTGAVQLARSWIERWLWGYGESPWLVLLWGVGAIAGFGLYYSGQAATIPESASLGLATFFRFSALAFVGSLDTSLVPGASPNAVAIEGTLGLVFVGILAAAIYRWMSIRQI